jgi:hypothetical protein
MARIRTIKPELFTDEQLAGLPPLARLAFPGLWCHADREGRLEDRPARLKVLILPYDDADMNELLTLLAQKRFIIRYERDGKRLIQVRTFRKHQHVNSREPASTLPAPDQHQTEPVPAPDEHSTEQVHAPAEHVRKGREGNGNGKGEEIARTRAAARPAGLFGNDEGKASKKAERRARAEAVVELWRNHCPSLPGVHELTDRRVTAIGSALGRVPALSEWEAYFARLERSAFCRGENERGWKADLDWALKPDSWVKAFEGRYDDRAPAGRIAKTADEAKTAMRERLLKRPGSGDIDLR